MNDWSYLDGKRWSEITRDERFFCQRLLVLAERNLPVFVRNLGTLVPPFGLTGDDWDLAYEVCFYRDLKYARAVAGLPWPLSAQEHSDKRTWDLCLFSKSRIIIIEAKAQQSFGSAQLKDFENDVRNVPLVANGIQPEFLFLASSRYLTEEVAAGLRKRFPGAATVTWKALAGLFDQDDDLLRADSLYAEKSKTGAELLELWKAGANLAVGRSGGVNALKHDLEGKVWHTRLYATGRNPEQRNWFSLQRFVEVVSPGDSRK